MRGILSRHRAFAAVLGLGILLRIAGAVAYWPGLLYSDSWSYLRAAYAGNPIAFDASRPSGYPLLIRIITLPARQLATITVAQHLAGLVIGVITYLLLLGLGARRWVAVVVAGAALLNTDLVVMEQYVMPETFFALCLVLGAYLLLGRELTASRIAASGALLGVACTLRAVGLFAIPVWVVFVLYRRVGVRCLAAGTGALAAPLLAYVALQAGTGHGSALDTADGWFLYGRTAGFADCGDRHIPPAAQGLCPRGGERGQAVSWYVWGPSPANRRFPRGAAVRDARANSMLRSFALAVIRDQPGTYAWTVSKGVLRLFVGGGGPDSADVLQPPTAVGLAAANASHAPVHAQYFAGSPLPRVGPTATWLTSVRWLFLPGLMGSALLTVMVVAMLAGLSRQGRRILPRLPAICLCGGLTLTLICGVVATVGPDYRYLLVTLPLLVPAGTLALEDLYAVASSLLSRRRQPAEARRRSRARFSSSA